MLRASSDYSGDHIDLNALTGGAVHDSGIEHGALLIAFAEAATAGDAARTKAARDAVQAAMGDAAVVDAAGIIGMFNGLDRVADATGAPLEDWKAEQTAEMRDAIGIDDFAAAKESLEAGDSG